MLLTVTNWLVIKRYLLTMIDNPTYGSDVNNTYEAPSHNMRIDQPRGSVYHSTADVYDYATQGPNEEVRTGALIFFVLHDSVNHIIISR